jgi:hypothetical protein
MNINKAHDRMQFTENGDIISQMPNAHGKAQHQVGTALKKLNDIRDKYLTRCRSCPLGTLG